MAGNGYSSKQYEIGAKAPRITQLQSHPHLKVGAIYDFDRHDGCGFPLVNASLLISCFCFRRTAVRLYGTGLPDATFGSLQRTNQGMDAIWGFMYETPTVGYVSTTMRYS